MSSTANIDKLKKLRTFAATLEGACEKWREKYSDRRHYDKQGFAFAYTTDLAAFTLPAIGFSAYVGTYGCSSVSRAWSIDQDLARQYFLNALNQHKQAIFDSMAAQASKDADALKEAASLEIEALRNLLDTAEQVPA